MRCCSERHVVCFRSTTQNTNFWGGVLSLHITIILTSKLVSYSRSVDNTAHKNVHIIFGRGIPIVLFKYISKLNKCTYSLDTAFVDYKYFV
jgi:hypothetical protein